MTLFNTNAYQDCLVTLERFFNQTGTDQGRVTDYQKRLDLNYAGTNITRKALPAFVNKMRSNSEEFAKFLAAQKADDQVAVAAIRQRFITEVSAATALAPGYRGQLETYLLNRLDIAVGDAGDAGLDIQRQKMAAESIIEILAMESVNETISELHKEVDRIVLSNNLSNADRLMLIQASTEYGGYASLVATDEAAKAVIRAKYQRYETYLESLGLDQIEIDTLNTAARAVNSAFDEPLRAASALGLSISRLPNANYIHRVYSSGGAEAVMKLVNESLFEPVATPIANLTNSVMQGRGYNTYTPKDPVSLASVLGLVPDGRVHVFSKESTTTVQLEFKPKSNAKNQYGVKKKQIPSILAANSNIQQLPDTVVNINSARQHMVGSALKDRRSDITKVTSSYDVYAPEILNFLGIPAVRIGDTAIVVADPTSLTVPVSIGANNLANAATVDALNLPDWRTLTSKGVTSTDTAKILTTFKRNARAELDRLAPNDAERFIKSYMDTNNVDAVIFKSGKGNTMLTRDGYDVNNFNQVSSFNWFTGRAEGLVDNAGTWQSQYIDDYNDVVTVTAKPGDSSNARTKLRGHLIEQVKNNPQLAKYASRVNDTKLSNEGLSQLAKEIIHGELGKKGFLFENPNTGVYQLLTFDHSLVKEWNAQAVTDLFSDSYALLELMRGRRLADGTYSPGKITQEQLDYLVDSGILSQIPMPSIEVSEYLIGKYNLPFHSPADMVSADLPSVMRNYVRMIKEAAATSFVIKQMLDDGVNLGWVTKGSEYTATDKPDWVSFGTEYNEHLKGLGYTKEQIDEIMDYKVHPVVARLLKAQLFIAADPVALGYTAKALHTVGSLARTSMLVASSVVPGLGYITSNLMMAMVSSLGGGGDALTLPNNIRSIFRVMAANSFDVLDNRPLYIHPDTGLPISQRDAARMFFSQFNTTVAPGTTDMASGLAAADKSLIAAALGFNYRDMASVWSWVTSNQITGTRGNMQRVGDATLATLDSANRLLRGILTPAIVVTALAERGVMFNHYLSLLRPVNDAGKFIRKKATSLTFFDDYAASGADLWKRMDETFIFGQKAGSITKALDQSGFTLFAPYVIKTPVNVLRQLARNPVPFYNFIRLLQFSKDVTLTANEVSQLEMPAYDLEGGDTYLGNYTDDNGDRNGLILYNNWNPYTQTYSWFDGMASFMDTTLLDQPRTYSAFLETSVKTDTTLFLEATRDFITQQAGLVYDMAYELVTGLNADTNRPIKDEISSPQSSFLWANLPNRVAKVLGRLPLLGVIDKGNHNYMFGKGAEIDPWTSETEFPGKLGMGDVERFPVRNLDRLKEAPRFVAITQMVGFDYKAVPYEDNEVAAIKSLDFAIDTLARQFNEVNQTLTEAKLREVVKSPHQIKRQKEAMTQVVDRYMTLLIMRAQYDAYALDQKRLPPRIRASLESAAMQAYIGNGSSYLEVELARLSDMAANTYAELENFGTP